MPKPKKIIWIDQLLVALNKIHKFAQFQQNKNPSLSIINILYNEWCKEKHNSRIGKPALRIKLSKLKRAAGDT